MTKPADPLNPWADDAQPVPVTAAQPDPLGPPELPPPDLPPAPGPRETWQYRSDCAPPLPQEWAAPGEGGPAGAVG